MAKKKTATRRPAPRRTAKATLRSTNRSRPAPVPRNARTRGVPPATQPPRSSEPQLHGAIPGGPGEGPPDTTAGTTDTARVPAGRRLTEKPPASERERLRLAMIEALENMPPEAFAWFVAWAAGNPGAMIFPEGLGGFTADSQATITRLRTSAQRFLEAVD